MKRVKSSFGVHSAAQQHAVLIQDFSLFPTENEIVLPPNMEFKVRDILHHGGGLVEVHCDQLDEVEALMDFKKGRGRKPQEKKHDQKKPQKLEGGEKPEDEKPGKQEEEQDDKKMDKEAQGKQKESKGPKHKTPKKPEEDSEAVEPPAKKPKVTPGSSALPQGKGKGKGKGPEKLPKTKASDSKTIKDPKPGAWRFEGGTCWPSSEEAKSGGRGGRLAETWQSRWW